MPAYYGEQTNSCALDRCLKRAADMIGWKEKYPCRDMGNGKVRSVGVAMAMQGVWNFQCGRRVCSPIKLEEDGVYALSIGAADMGTGCDTTMAQVAAECLDCSMEQIIVSGADTRYFPL